jgi:2-amino-4-hydroxy-6-hydroxymethyldihydropteridine diphosphokinase
MNSTVYLGLGTNLGDRFANLQAAVTALPPAVVPGDCSPVYETAPWGFEDQPAFLNQVLRGYTRLEPPELLRHLKTIEGRMGRQPTIKYGPRIIDIDILFYGRLVLETENLTIPHPRLEERAFVLVPLADLAPGFRHPVLDKTIRDLLAEMDATGVIWHAPGECGKI